MRSELFAHELAHGLASDTPFLILDHANHASSLTYIQTEKRIELAISMAGPMSDLLASQPRDSLDLKTALLFAAIILKAPFEYLDDDFSRSQRLARGLKVHDVIVAAVRGLNAAFRARDFIAATSPDWIERVTAPLTDTFGLLVEKPFSAFSSPQFMTRDEFRRSDPLFVLEEDVLKAESLAKLNELAALGLLTDGRLSPAALFLLNTP